MKFKDYLRLGMKNIGPKLQKLQKIIIIRVDHDADKVNCQDFELRQRERKVSILLDTCC